MAKGALGENWKHFNELIGVKIQKKERPPIEKIIELLITNPEMKDYMNKIVRLLNENNAKPAWFTTSHYKFKHNKEISFQIKIGDGFKFRENEIYMTIHTTSPQNINQFKQSLSDKLCDLISATSADFNVCTMCTKGHSCKNRADFEFEGRQYHNICAKNIEVHFPLDSSTINSAEQFQMIEELISKKIEYNSAICT